MNTMKKEEMLKEKGELIVQVGYMTMGILQPVVQLFGAVGRLAYLAAKIAEATPHKAPEPVENIFDKIQFKEKE